MNTNTGQAASPERSERALMVTGIVVHLVAIGLALWEIYEKHFVGN